MTNDLSYWLALAHVPKVRTAKKNEILVKLFENGNDLAYFFECNTDRWATEFNLSDNDQRHFLEVTEEISNYAFLAEDLLDQGYHIIPITSDDYSPTLKKNLGKSHAPPLLYAKGNLEVMKEDSIAIVGSRQANDAALEFTDNMAKRASKGYKVVVSGFAKGVDKQALDSAVKYKGQSIIVLPQGITTFGSGFKKYHKQIVEGDVLVVSTFHPKAPWNVSLAMARNPIIYGLAKSIYVAQSAEKGGTWSGVVDGLRKGRNIYVRTPGDREKTANPLLIEKGGIPVDAFGDKVEYEKVAKNPPQLFEPGPNENVESKIIALLQKGKMNSKAIVATLRLNLKPQQVTALLKKHPAIDVIPGKPLKFALKDKRNLSLKQASLFDE